MNEEREREREKEREQGLYRDGLVLSKMLMKNTIIDEWNENGDIHIHTHTHLHIQTNG